MISGRRLGSCVAIIGSLPLMCCGQWAQSGPPPSAGFTIKATQLPSSAAVGITEIPLPVDMDLAKQFVTIGFGPKILGKMGFQSTEFLTPTLSTRQASELVLLVPEYGSFKGAEVAKGIQRFAGRVSGVAFGREGSPVLYVHLPYWTHQREVPLPRLQGSKITDQDNEQLVEELRRVFVGERGSRRRS